MICIIDTGVGNFKSIKNMLSRLSYNSIITANLEDIAKANKIILPGVGAFDEGINQLKKYKLDTLIKDMAQLSNVKILGICLGMQMLGNSSEEGGSEGLGLISGKIRKFTKYTLCNKLKIPQMGWNYVIPKRESILFAQNFKLEQFESFHRFYFAHSYWFDCVNLDNVIAVTPYGDKYPSVIWNGRNVYGVQFHPEKSHRFGLELLKRFATC